MDKNLKRYLDKLVRQLYKEITDILYKNKKMATGNLINSIKAYYVERKINDKEYKVLLDVDYASYGKYVLSGRKAGKFPPVDAIKKWLMIKFPQLRQGKNQNKLNQVAFLVGRKIKEKVIRPINFLKPIENILNNKSFIEELNLSIFYDVDEEIKKYLK